MMSTPWKSPKFDNPPVVETVLGIQFPTLAFTSAHLGWFWKGYLGSNWPKAEDAPPLQEQFERFGEAIWALPVIQVAFTPIPATRLRFSDEAGDRFVQVQNTRFIYNWRKQQNAYPSYRQSRVEFFNLYQLFCRFVRDAGLGAVAPNQWEVSYIDHIPKGNLWQSPSDWHKVLPGLLPPSREVSGLRFENAGEWHYEIEPQKGRLHIALQHVRAGSATGPEVLQVQWTARGPISGQEDNNVGAGLDLAHDTILRAFIEMTSAEAHRAWGRKE